MVRAALPAPDPDNGGIYLPQGFRATVVADELTVGKKVGKSQDTLRFAAAAPNGDLYVKLKHGGILALRDADGDGRFEIKEEFAASPGSGGTGIMFHGPYLYYSTRTSVHRIKYTPGELVPKAVPETIVSDLPAGKDHDAKSFAFDDQGRMIVEVGSYFNVLSDGDRRLGAKGKTDAEVAEFQRSWGGFWRFDPDKLNQKQSDGFHFSTGHRHAMGLVWHPVSKTFFMIQMGRDNLNTIDPEHYDELDNAERVSEAMFVLHEGANFGWPYAYWDPIKKAHMLAPEYGGDNHKKAAAGKYDEPVVAFPAHWAPIQMCLYSGTQFPEHYRNGMFVAFHGSWNRAPRSQAGYKIAFVPFDSRGQPKGDYEAFADGFPGVEEFVNTKEAKYRPAGVTMGPDGSLYVTDTERGRIWRIFYTGESTPGLARTVPTPKTETASTQTVKVDEKSKGAQVYAQICAACHMPDGNGVPSMQPSLVTSAVVKGNVDTLIRTVLEGPAAVLPADREKFQVVMPPMSVLDDESLAGVISYIRARFAQDPKPVTPAQIKALRKAP